MQFNTKISAHYIGKNKKIKKKHINYKRSKLINTNIYYQTPLASDINNN